MRFWFTALVRAAGDILRVLVYGFLALVFLLFVLPSLWPTLSGGVRGRYLRQQKHYARSFQAGDTNVPLFAMDYFEPTVHFCRVNQSGKGAARRDVGHAIQAGVTIALDKTNLQALVAIIQQLPRPPKQSLPAIRQIVVGCVRSNQWFRAVYDRASIPNQLERIATLTGASLPWYIPVGEGQRVVGTGGGFLGVATDAPVAVAGGQGFLEIWRLDVPSEGPLSRLKIYPGNLSLFSYEHPVAITPDGTMVAAATDYNLWCLDWRKGKVLWKAGVSGTLSLANRRAEGG